MKELKRKEVEENLRILVNWDSVRGGNETIYQNREFKITEKKKKTEFITI